MTKLKFRSSISKFTTEGIENKRQGGFSKTAEACSESTPCLRLCVLCGEKGLQQILVCGGGLGWSRFLLLWRVMLQRKSFD